MIIIIEFKIFRKDIDNCFSPFYLIFQLDITERKNKGILRKKIRRKKRLVNAQNKRNPWRHCFSINHWIHWYICVFFLYISISICAGRRTSENLWIRRLSKEGSGGRRRAGIKTRLPSVCSIICRPVFNRAWTTCNRFVKVRFRSSPHARSSTKMSNTRGNDPPWIYYIACVPFERESFEHIRRLIVVSMLEMFHFSHYKILSTWLKHFLINNIKVASKYFVIVFLFLFIFVIHFLHVNALSKIVIRKIRLQRNSLTN